MHRCVRTFVAMSILLATASAAHAVSDHLQCLKIKDTTTKAQYLADITPSDTAFAAAAGCKIKVPAKLLCVDATKSNVTPAPPGSADGLPAQKYLCYQTKCPVTKPTATITDQFGTHSVTVKSTGFVCAPVPAPATCTDLTENGNETDVDCGGGTCPACANGLQCALASDCTSGLCTLNVCTAPAPSCTDFTQNGSETGIDCGGGSCPQCGNGQGCASASDCISGLCSAGICTSGLGNGSACSLNGQCTSGSCVDGVCCNSACSGTCQACTFMKKGSGMDGACGPISSGFDPDSECAASPASSCGTNGFCSGMNSCDLYSAATVCTAGSCSAGLETPNAFCNGGGTCLPATPMSCGAYQCNGTNCANSCATDGNCATGFYCSASTCVPKNVDGTVCTLGNECQSGSCVDGFCCNSSCGNTCEACSAAKTGAANGVCNFIPAATDPDNECAGSFNCNGVGTCVP